jgi:hypothetical protein
MGTMGPRVPTIWGKAPNNDSRILLPIRHIEQRIHGDSGSHQEPILFFQKGDQANTDNYKEFMAMLEVIEEYGYTGSLTHFPNLLKQELEAKELDLSENLHLHSNKCNNTSALTKQPHTHTTIS